MGLLTDCTLGEPTVVPFHTFLVKAASRCNINCTYCYIYNRADSRWRRQPAYMSPATAEAAIRRIAEHVRRHKKDSAAIIFHGGEPLLVGPKQLDTYARIVADAFADLNVRLTVGMQSNGLLFNERLGDLMLRWGISIGISLDGPPEINDKSRLDRRGRPTSATLERKLALLTSPKYRPLFTGFLTVIDIESDPVDVVRYLLSFSPPSLDFLFPLDNHDRRPPGKIRFDATPYGDWLIRAFDYWASQNTTTRIRIFETLLGLSVGSRSIVETFGTDPVDLIVVESNGEVEGVDSLKAVFNGATALGFNVFDHDFDQVAAHVAVKARQAGVSNLSPICRDCALVKVCGGGYYPHRYSQANGFTNPSIYCHDIAKLIRHLQNSAVSAARAVAVA